MKKSVFLKNSIEQQLEEQGWAVVDFCDKDTVENLKAIFFRFLPQIDYMPIIITVLLKDRSITQSINTVLLEVLSADLNRHFTDYKVAIAHFFAKKPKAEVKVELHQDPMITDQVINPSYGLWLPLIETDMDNGSLAVLTGSHRWFHPFHADTIPAALSNINEQLMADCTTLYLKPGQAVIMDNRLAHYSHPNNSNELRPAVVIKFTHKKSDYYTLYNQGGDIHLIKNNEAFYLNERWICDKSEFPAGEVLGKLDFVPNEVTASEYAEIKNNNFPNYYQSKSIKNFLKN